MVRSVESETEKPSAISSRGSDATPSCTATWRRMRCACGTHARAQVSAHASAHAVPMQCTRAGGVARPTLERELAECRHPKEQPHRSPSRGSSVASTDERPNRFLSRRASRVPRSAQRARRANALAARASRPRSLATALALPSPLRAPAIASPAAASPAAASPAAASPAAASPAASPAGLRGRPRLRVALKVSEDSCSEAPRPSAASPSVRIVSCRVACHRSVRTDAHAVYMCELQSRLAGKSTTTHGWCVPWDAPRNALRTALRHAPPAVRHAMYATLKERLASHASPHGVTEAETTPTEWRERRRLAEMPSAAAPERRDVDRSTWEWEGRRVNRRLRPGLTAAPQSPSGP